MLNLDASLLFVFILVFALMVILDKLFYKPVGKIIRERESKEKNESDSILDLTKKIEEQTGNIETILKNARKDAMKIKEELIQSGEQVREKLLSDTREKSKSFIESNMKKLDREIDAAEEKLKREIESFSNAIKEKFL